MKAKIKIEKEFEFKTLHVKAKVRYWEDASVNGQTDEDGELIPCRVGDNWQPVIDVDTGIIRNGPRTCARPQTKKHERSEYK